MWIKEIFEKEEATLSHKTEQRKHTHTKNMAKKDKSNISFEAINLFSVQFSLVNSAFFLAIFSDNTFSPIPVDVS